MISFGLQKENMYGHKKRCEFILSMIDKYSKDYKNKQIRILDVGCGTGEMIALPIADAGYNITGVDIDIRSINRANNLNVYKNATFICENLDDLVAKREKYDVVICSEVLEHLSDPNKMLSMMCKVMREEGSLIVTIPNGFGPFEIEKFIFEKTGLFKVIMRVGKTVLSIFGILDKFSSKKDSEYIHMTENVECGHIQFFTMRKFEQMVKSHGLKIEMKLKSSFLAGIVTCLIFGKSHKFIKWNVNHAVNALPYFLSSGWYFVIKFDKEKKS